MHGNFLPHALRTVQKFGGKLIGKNHTGRTRFRRKKFQGGKNGKVSYEPFWMDQRKTNQASFRTPRFRKKIDYSHECNQNSSELQPYLNGKSLQG